MTAIHLNPVAVSSVALLRAIRAGGWTNLKELAEAAGRSPKNIARDLDILRNAALLATSEVGANPALSDIGGLQLDAIERAERGGDEPGLPVAGMAATGILFLRHEQIVPDPDNAREDWDTEEAVAELASLADDIADHGLLQNLIVRPGPDGDREPLYTLVGGERRWRAIGLLLESGRWSEDALIPARLRQSDDIGHRLAALSENLKRRNLNPLEKAKAFEGLAEAFLASGVDEAKVNREIADRVGVTIEHVQQHRSFMRLDDADQVRLTLPKDDPKRLTVTDARKKLAAKAAQQDRWTPSQHPTDEQLVMAELLVAARDRSTYLGGFIPVDASIVGDAVAKRLSDQHLIRLPDGPSEHFNWPGHFTTCFEAWTFTDTLRCTWPDLTDADETRRHDALRDLQQTLVGRQSEGLNFLTPWLNGPFALTPEGQQIADRRKEEAAAREKAESERQAENKARDQRWIDARQRHLRLMAAAQERPEAGEPVELASIAGDIDLPLPWTLMPNGFIHAANGSVVRRRESWSLEHDLAVGQLIVVAANVAAAQLTPAIPSPDADDDEPEQDIDGNDPDANADEDEADA